MKVRSKMLALFIGASLVAMTITARAIPIESGPGHGDAVQITAITGTEGPPAAITQEAFAIPHRDHVVQSIGNQSVPITAQSALIAAEVAQNTMSPAPKWMVISVPTKIELSTEVAFESAVDTAKNASTDNGVQVLGGTLRGTSLATVAAIHRRDRSDHTAPETLIL
jgi:hypothetical protein